MLPFYDYTLYFPLPSLTPCNYQNILHFYNLVIFRIYICVCVYVCTYICTYMYIWIYTHTHMNDWTIQYIAFGIISFIWYNSLQIHPAIICLNVYFLLLSSVPWYECITDCLTIHQLKDILAVSHYVLLEINLPWTSICRFLCKH